MQKRDLRREAVREDEAALPDDKSGNMSVSRCSRNACIFLKSQLATTFTISNGCNTLQLTATHCNTLRHTATHCDTRYQMAVELAVELQHSATHCNTLQHTATHCDTRYQTAVELAIELQHTATHCNTLQHTATHNIKWL